MSEIVEVGTLQPVVQVFAGGIGAVALGDAGADQPVANARGLGFDLGNADERQQGRLDLGRIDVALVADAARLTPRRPIGQQPGQYRLLAEGRDGIPDSVVHRRKATRSEIKEH
jgi:hypothetical protein